MTAPAPKWVRVVTVAAVSVVAAVAAVASYVHMHELATDAGEGWRAHLIPLSVDGMLVAASMVMLVRRRAGEDAGLLPWVGLVLGLVASLAANVAAANPTVLSWIVSGWPPLALAVSFELLILVTRDRQLTTSQSPAVELDRLQGGAEPDPLVVRAHELGIADAGRPTLIRELGISDHQAKQLQRHLRQPAVNGAVLR